MKFKFYEHVTAVHAAQITMETICGDDQSKMVTWLAFKTSDDGHTVLRTARGIVEVRIGDWVVVSGTPNETNRDTTWIELMDDLQFRRAYRLATYNDYGDAT